MPPVNATAKNAACIFYSYTIKGGFCKDIITTMYVFGNSSTLKYGERQTSTFRGFFDLFNLSEKCRPIMRDMYCRYHFPPCDTSQDKPKARGICRTTCEYLYQELCKQEMISISGSAAMGSIRDMFHMTNCSSYDIDDIPNGGDAPECYQYHPLSGSYISVIQISLSYQHEFHKKRVGNTRYKKYKW